MGGASQGTPTPMMSPAPPGGPQDMAGYGMGINGSDYGSQPYNDGSMGYDPMHQVSWTFIMHSNIISFENRPENDAFNNSNDNN